MITLTFENDNVPKIFRRMVERATPKLAARLGISDYNVRLSVGLRWKPVKVEGGWGYGALGPDKRFEEARLEEGLPPRAFHLMAVVAQMPDKFLETICHEFVHLKQWITGELRGWVDEKEKYNLAYLSNPKAHEIPYDEQPWEKEALSLQVSLADWLAETLISELEAELSEREEKLAA